MNRFHLLAAGAVVLLACKPKPPTDRPDSAALRALPAPPTNAPLNLPASRDSQGPVTTQLPGGAAPALLVLRGGRPFSGTLNVSGSLTFAAGRIRVAPAADSAIELLYRLPQGLPPVRAESLPGTVAIVAQSTPDGGADQRVVLRAGERLVLAEIWQTAREPVTLDLGNGVRLVQQRVQGNDHYVEAPLDAVTRSGSVRIPLGRVTAAGGVSVYAEISHLLNATEADGGPAGSFFILKAWVVPSR